MKFLFPSDGNEKSGIDSILQVKKWILNNVTEQQEPIIEVFWEDKLNNSNLHHVSQAQVSKSNKIKFDTSLHERNDDKIKE